MLGRVSTNRGSYVRRNKTMQHHFVFYSKYHYQSMQMQQQKSSATETERKGNVRAVL